MSLDFSDRKFLIIGAVRSIGRALAIAFLEAGGEVYALSCQQTHRMVKEYPGIEPIQCDLSDWDVTRAQLGNLGPIDGLVNIAGKKRRNRRIDISCL